jgi:hypothetical protein
MITDWGNWMASNRYSLGGTVEVINGHNYWNKRVFLKSPDDLEIKIDSRYHQKPYLLAFDYYGSDHLSWFILQYNNILDVTTEFVNGATIYIPTVARFRSL